MSDHAPRLLRTKLFLNNQFVDATSGEFLSIYNPNDESLVTNAMPVASLADVDAAVDGALHAFRTGPWSTFTPAKRAKYLLKLADLMEQNAEDLWVLEHISMGLPRTYCDGTIAAAATALRYYAGWADKIAGQSFRSEGGSAFTFVNYEPLGVCAGIAPWNASLTTFAWKAGPALAAGNTIVIKSSERAPFGLVALGELLVEAGFPPGVVQILSGPGSTGALLAKHMKISKVSFTGSVETGIKIQEMALRSNMKRCTLELGGKSPAIVFDDADIPNAVLYCTLGLLINSGQACIASSRILVQEGIAPKFTEALKASFSTFKGLGPMVDRKHYERVMAFIEAGKLEAELLVGGNRAGDKGHFIEPTIFCNPTLDASIYNQEIFGPVGTVCVFKSEEEVIELANNTLFGLSGAIFTKSMSRALRVSSRLQCGTIGVNQSFSPGVQAPFGGWKQSGVGRELGLDGLMAYLEAKTVQINMKT